MSISIWHWIWRLDILLVLRFSVFKTCHANIILTSNIDIESQGLVIKTQCLLKFVRLTSTMSNSSCDIKCLKFNAWSKLELDVTTMLCFDIAQYEFQIPNKQTFWRFWCLPSIFIFNQNLMPTQRWSLISIKRRVCNTFSPPLVSKDFLDVTLTSSASWDWSYLDFYSHTMRVMRNLWVYILFAGLVSW